LALIGFFGKAAIWLRAWVTGLDKALPYSWAEQEERIGLSYHFHIRVTW